AVDEDGASPLRPAADRGIRQQRVHLALVGAVFRADDGGPEVRRDAAELRPVQDRYLETERLLAPRLRDQEIELSLVFGNHQSAGDSELTILAEFPLESLPETHGFAIKRQPALEAGDVLREIPQKHALQLDMNAA